MKKTILMAAAVCMGMTHASAQDYLIDSLASGSSPYVGTGGEMGQIVYTYYKTAKHPDSLKFDMLGPRMSKMGGISIAAKGLGDVIASTTNGQLISILFYNKSNKQATLYITDPNGIGTAKKTLKGIDPNEKIFLATTMNPEKFIMIQETKNGYQATGYNLKLEEQWTVKGDKQLITIKPNMDVVHIVCRTTAGGAVKYTLDNLQGDEGTIISSTDLVDGNDNLYPLFMNSFEGMTHSGGVYFTGGKGLDKTPEGIYYTQVTPDGKAEQIIKTPYSQVIQDIKGGYASKLTSGEYKIVLHEGVRKMDGSGFVVNGEIYSAKNTADGNVLFKTYDIITIIYNEEMKYQKTVVTKSHSKEATVKGSITKQNSMDVAEWLKGLGFFSYKAFKESGLKGNIICMQDDGHTTQLCAKVTGDSTYIQGICFMATKMGEERGPNDNKPTFNSDAPQPLARVGLIPGGMPDQCVVYNYKFPQVMIWSTPYPSIDNYEDDPNRRQDAPPTDDAPPPPPQDEQ